MAVIYLVLTAISLVTFYFFFNTGKKSDGTPPGSLGFPFLGETIAFLTARNANRSYEFVHKRMEKYGPLFKTSLVGAPTVIFPAPSGNRFLFSNEGKLVVNAWPSSIARLLGPDSLTAKTGNDFKKSKQVLMAFLKPEALQRYVGRTSTVCRNRLDKEWHGKEQVGTFWSVKGFTFSTVCNLFLSMDGKAEQEELVGPFHGFQSGMFQLPFNFPGTKYHKALKCRAVIDEFLDKHMLRRRRQLEEGTASEDQDLLSVLLTTRDENGQLVSESEIKDNIVLVLFAGHDTSTSVLTMAIKFLAGNPVWKKHLLEEHMEILSDKQKMPGSDYVLNWSDLNKMKWTWRVVQETLRIMPPAQGAFRKAMVDFEYDGYKIPKGWTLFWNINTSHTREEFFPDPFKFDPTRFEGEGPAPFTFIPFGGGPRMCPGNEFAKMLMLVFLHYVVVSFDWDLVDKDEKIRYDPMPIPAKGLQIKLKAI